MAEQDIADESRRDGRTVVEISSTDTHALRRAVLRNGDPNRTVVYPEDDLPGTVHLGIRDADGEIIATSSWVPKPLDGFPGRSAVQLRGMAISSSLQSGGIGGHLFETAVQRWAGSGAELVWARARDSALNFYAKHGCRVVGDGFIDDTSGLPHHVVVRDFRGDVRLIFPLSAARSTQRGGGDAMPPGGSGSAEQLRERATQIRAAASRLESSSALDLYRRAGDDVWRGPTPTRCRDELTQMRACLQRAADDLRDAARRLDQRAAQLDVASTARAQLGGGCI